MATPFINASVNESATIVRPAKAVLTDPWHKAVALNDDGTVGYPAAAGGLVFGICLSNQDDVAAGESVHIAIAGIVPVNVAAAGEIKAGQEVSFNTNGEAIVAATGHFIAGICVEPGSASGRCYVQLTKSGYKA